MSRKERLLRWLLVLLLVLVAGYFSLGLSMKDNALDLLPDGRVRSDLQLLQEIGLVDRLVITLSAQEKSYPDPIAAQRALEKSATALETMLEKDRRFSHVFARFSKQATPMGPDFFSYLPVLSRQTDMVKIRERLSEEALTERMAETFSLLNSLAGIALKRQLQIDPLDFSSLLTAKLSFLRDGSTISLKNGFLLSKDGRNILVFAESRLGLTDSNNAKEIEQALKKIYEQALLPGIIPRVIGTLPHTLANSQAIKHDLQTLLPMATLLLFLLLAFSLKNIKAIVVFAVPLLASLPAIAITSSIFKGISGLALGFGIVLLGIAVDFSIHLFIALHSNGKDRRTILAEMRRPILFASLTTLAVFFVLFFSNVPAHRQMACLAFTGLLFGICFAWLLIPTTCTKANILEESRGEEPSPLRFMGLRKGCSLLWLALLCLGVFAWPQIRYNGDLKSLDAPGLAVLADEAYFAEAWGKPQEKVFVVSLGDKIQTALEKNDRLFYFLEESGFKQIQSLAPILPSLHRQKENRQRWQGFWSEERLKFSPLFKRVAAGQGFAPEAFFPFFHWLENPTGPLKIEHLQSSPLDPMLGLMIRSSLSQQGERRAMVLTSISGDREKLPALLLFTEQNPEIHLLAGEQWKAEVEGLLKKNILFLSGLAGIFVLALVSIQFRNVAAIIAVLAPVLAALAGMLVFCWIMGYTLNMMHLIMGIMVIGLAVDYGIFAVCSRLKQSLQGTEKAISICAASSLIGFGVLAFSSHPALHSLGITVLVGIGIGWPVALVVSPYLFTLGSRRND
ncbi:MMPL family transporter [Desulfotalea psychrophila]|nr:MMPL family transporter [Desulfotalea psychrophila]